MNIKRINDGLDGGLFIIMSSISSTKTPMLIRATDLKKVSQVYMHLYNLQIISRHLFIGLYRTKNYTQCSS